MKRHLQWLASLSLVAVLALGLTSCTADQQGQPESSQHPEKVLVKEAPGEVDLTKLWSYGLTSKRTGEPMVEKGGEHKMDKSKVSYGYNLVVDKNGTTLQPRGRPFGNGDKLILTKTYQEDENMREYTRVFTFIAPIRDAILYRFDQTTKEQWLELTWVLKINNIKTVDSMDTGPQRPLSIEQVYDYVAGRPTQGSPVMRFLDEAELELKCLAFVNFDFTNPKGQNHCTDHNIKVGSGIKLP